MRICSLLPSATEILFSLGLGDHLVAVTHECDYPAEVAHFPTITYSAIDHRGSSSREIHTHVSQYTHSGSSIYSLNRELLEKLNPDIILTQELCHVCAVSYQEVERAVRQLEAERKILSLEPTTLEGILESIEQVGHATATAVRAVQLVQNLQKRVDRVRAEAEKTQTRPRVFAMEWLDPPFVGGHWVPQMVRLAGGRDELGRESQPSFEISWADIAHYDPEVFIFMPCGFNLERTVKELARAAFPEPMYKLAAVQSGRIYAVDGSAYFNRPGPRIVDGLEILAEIIHPDRFPRQKPSQAWKPVGLTPQSV